MTDTGSTWSIRLPWTKPPASMNDRGHWSTRARKAKTIRSITAILVRQEQVPASARIHVELGYNPRDARRRDADNLTATLKACCDGIVDAGVVVDDDPAHMSKAMPVIGDPLPDDPHLWLTITILEEATP